MPRSARTPSLAAAIVDRLAQAYPGATTELAYRNAFELLVATILSAQSTDARVNEVTPTLFARFPDAASLAAAPLPEVERLIRPTGFFRTKARAIVGMARQLVERHGGEVPASMEALVALPGVGRKTASVVLGHALGVAALPVDRHVLRVAGRLGLARGKTPEAVEAELRAALPAHLWTLASDCLILHGRRVCRPKPLCERCMVSSMCAFYRHGARPSPGRRSPASPGTAARTGGRPGRAAASPRRRSKAP
jgi:endonuclease-3